MRVLSLSLWCACLLAGVAVQPAAAAAPQSRADAAEVVIPHVFVYYQDRTLTCEETAVSMALTHQHIYVSQDIILKEIGDDPRPMIHDADGRVRWGDPYRGFVGSPTGFEFKDTGYMAGYAPLVRVARAHGATVLRSGAMDVDTVYAAVQTGHPVVVWATWDWRWHPRHDYLAFDGTWVPWIGPFDAHVYTVAGIRADAVLVDDPMRGQYWEPKDSFEAAYSDFEEAIVFA